MGGHGELKKEKKLVQGFVQGKLLNPIIVKIENHVVLALKKGNKKKSLQELRQLKNLVAEDVKALIKASPRSTDYSKALGELKDDLEEFKDNLIEIIKKLEDGTCEKALDELATAYGKCQEEIDRTAKGVEQKWGI